MHSIIEIVLIVREHTVQPTLNLSRVQTSSVVCSLPAAAVSDAVQVCPTPFPLPVHPL